MSINWPRTILFFLLLVSLGLAIPLFIGGRGAFALLLTLPWWDWLAFLVVMLLTWSLNVARLWLLFDGPVRGLGYWRLMRIYMATEFVSKTTPMGAGAPAAAVSLLAPHGIKPVSSLAIFGASAFMDSVVLVGLMACFAIGGLTVSQGASFVTGIFLYAGIMLIVICAATLLLYRHKLLFYLLVSMPGFSLTGKRGQKLAGKLVVSLHRAFSRIAGLPRRRLVLSWGACLLYWGVYLSTLYLCVRALGGKISWIESGFIQTIAMGMGHLLMIPGGAGGADISGALLLEPLLGATLAATVIILWRLLMLYLYLVVGGISLLSLIRSGRSAKAEV